MAETGRRKYWIPSQQFIRLWVRIHIWVYRRSRGRMLYRMRGMPTLLLTTTGRRTGNARTVALPYMPDGDGKIVVGSFAGAEHDPAWVLNLRARPEAGIEDREGPYRARAEILAGADREVPWSSLVARYPWYGDYQTRTAREIPLVRLVAL